MENIFTRAARFLREQRLHKRWRNIVSALAAAVVFCTTYALILPAMTAERQTACGMEEHTHTSECYQDGVQVCGKQEHTHTEECYPKSKGITVGVVIGGQGDTQEEEGDAGVPEVVPDGVEIGIEDVSSQEAPVEEKTQEQLEQELGALELTGSRAQDVVAAAKAFTGYREESREFVSAVLKHARVKGLPKPKDKEGDTAEYPGWIKKLRKAGLYEEVSTIPEAGDLVFLDRDEDPEKLGQEDDRIDHVGIIVSVRTRKAEDGSETLRDIMILTEDLNGQIGSFFYNMEDPVNLNMVAGYAELPEDTEEVELGEDQGAAAASLEEGQPEPEGQPEAAEPGTESQTEITETGAEEPGTEAQTQPEAAGLETEAQTETTGETGAEEPGTEAQTEQQTAEAAGMTPETGIENIESSETDTGNVTEEPETETDTALPAETDMEAEPDTEMSTDTDTESETDTEMSSEADIESETGTEAGEIETESFTEGAGTETGETGTESLTEEAETDTENSAEEPETDTGSLTEESETNTEMSTEADTEAETDMEMSTEADTEAETDMEMPAEADTESETGTEMSTEEDTESETDTEMSSETDIQEPETDEWDWDWEDFEDETDDTGWDWKDFETEMEAGETESSTEGSETEAEDLTEEPETDTESITEKSETETGTESETDTEMSTETDMESETDTEMSTETDTESETGTEMSTETDTESETDTEMSSETDIQEPETEEWGWDWEDFEDETDEEGWDWEDFEEESETEWDEWDHLDDEEETESGGDPKADLETSEDWEASVADAELTGIWADDVAAVALTQLGVKESTENYELDGNGEQKGITRYGQWYGDPYGDWDAMFVSFCLNYAEVPHSSVPRAGSCGSLIEMLQVYGLYVTPEEYKEASKGDLVFLDTDADGTADHAGILEEVTEAGTGGISVIAGDMDNEVKSTAYAQGDAAVIGYGVLPQKPNPKVYNKTYNDGKVMVKAEYTAEAVIPENAVLIAKEVPQDDEVYKQHYETVREMMNAEKENQTEGAAQEEGISTVSMEDGLPGEEPASEVWDETEPETEEKELYMRVYNIGFYVDEQEVEPQAEVKISIEFLDDPGFAAGANKVIHMEEGKEPEALDVTNTEEEESGTPVNRIEFSTKTF